MFNAHGLSTVSTHRIAAELGISPGNLHYHFKSKRLIVDWLFRRFETRLAALSEGLVSVGAIDDLWLALHLMFEAVSAYRFIYRDMALIDREFPDTAERLRARLAANLLEAKALCSNLADAGLLQATDDEVDMLALQIAFTMTSWLSFEQMVSARSGDAPSDNGLAAYYTLTLLAPYVEPQSRAYLDYLRSKYLGA